MSRRQNLSHFCEFPKTLSWAYVVVVKQCGHQLNWITFTFKKISSFKSFKPKIIESKVSFKIYHRIDFLVIFANNLVNFRSKKRSFSSYSIFAMKEQLSNVFHGSFCLFSKIIYRKSCSQNAVVRMNDILD